MSESPSSKIELTPQVQRLIEQLVAAGRYRSAEEAVEAGICRLVEEEAQRTAAVDDIRRRIAEGIEQEERGELLDGDAVMAEWRRLDEDDARRSRRSA